MNRSTFASLNLSVTALRGFQQEMDTTGQNIANVDTEGYTRRVAILQAIPADPPTMSGTGQRAGGGVELLTYQRMRDPLVDRQVRDQIPVDQRYQQQMGAYEQIQAILPEPSDVGLRSLMDRFYGAFKDLASQPVSVAARQSVIEKGRALAEQFNQIDQQLTTVADQVDDEISVKLTELNSFTEKIASLNQTIFEGQVVGDTLPDLRDQRDLLIDKISKLANVSVVPNANGMINVTVGGHAAVNGNASTAVASEAALTALTGGQIKGMQDIRDTIVPSYRAQADALAAGIIESVNDQHVLGFDQAGVAGTAFFAGTDAGSFALSATITDPSKIAASSDGSAQSGTNAITLSNTRDVAGAVSGLFSVDGGYRSLISDLGNKASETRRQVQAQENVTVVLLNRRDNLNGVSLDEEMANLIRFQHAYSAAARSLTAFDEQLDRLINRTGRVGL